MKRSKGSETVSRRVCVGTWRLRIGRQAFTGKHRALLPRQGAQTSTLKPEIADASEGSRDAAPAPSFLLHSIHSTYSHAMPQILTVLEEFLDSCYGSCSKSLYLPPRCVFQGMYQVLSFPRLIYCLLLPRTYLTSTIIIAYLNPSPHDIKDQKPCVLSNSTALLELLYLDHLYPSPSMLI